MELTSSLWALYNDLSLRLCRSVFLGRKFQEVTLSDKTTSLIFVSWTSQCRHMHSSFHRRPFWDLPNSTSACRSRMALWASHRRLSQLRQWRAEDKEYLINKWTISFTVSKWFKMNICIWVFSCVLETFGSSLCWDTGYGYGDYLDGA